MKQKARKSSKYKTFGLKVYAVDERFIILHTGLSNVWKPIQIKASERVPGNISVCDLPRFLPIFVFDLPIILPKIDDSLPGRSGRLRSSEEGYAGHQLRILILQTVDYVDVDSLGDIHSLVT